MARFFTSYAKPYENFCCRSHTHSHTYYSGISWDGQIPPNCYYKQTKNRLDWLPLCSLSKKHGFSMIWTEERTLRCVSGWEAMLEPLSTACYESCGCHLGEGGRCSAVVNKTLFPGAPGTPLGLCFLFEAPPLYSFSKLFWLLQVLFISIGVLASGCQFLPRGLLVFWLGLFWTDTLSRGEVTS